MPQKRTTCLTLVLLFLGYVVSSHTLVPPDTVVSRYERFAPENALFLGPYFSAGSTEAHLGAEVGFLRRTGVTPGSMLGFNAGLALYGSFNNAKAGNYYKYIMVTLGPRIAWKTGRHAFFTVDPAFVVGREERYYSATINSNGGPKLSRALMETKQIKGFQLGLGLLWMFPVYGSGFYLSANVFARNEASTLFDRCMGFRLGVGFRL